MLRRSPVDLLPVELLMRIFGHLPPESLVLPCARGANVAAGLALTGR